MLQTIVALGLAVILALFSLFQEKIVSYLRIKGFPGWILNLLVSVLVFFVFFLFPFAREKGETERQTRVEQKLDKIIGSLGILEYDSPTEGKILIPSRGIKRTFQKGLEGTGSIVLRFITKNFENAVVNGKYYLFDLFSKFPNEDRISMYIQTINSRNNLVVQVFDSNRNSYLIRHDIGEWKDNTRYPIALLFSDKTKEVSLAINGIIVQQLQIEKFKFNSLGSEVYLFTDYSGKGE